MLGFPVNAGCLWATGRVLKLFFFCHDLPINNNFLTGIPRSKDWL